MWKSLPVPVLLRKSVPRSSGRLRGKKLEKWKRRPVFHYVVNSYVGNVENA